MDSIGKTRPYISQLEPATIDEFAANHLKQMTQTGFKGLFVFKEQSFLFGIRPSDFDAYLPLNKLWISPSEQIPQLWRFEGEKPQQQGYFTSLSSIFDFQETRFSQSGILFLKTISRQKTIGLALSDFLMRLVNKKSGAKSLTMDLVKNFPKILPKTAFHSVQRYKRKNILIINPEGLFEQMQIEWPLNNS